MRIFAALACLCLVMSVPAPAVAQQLLCNPAVQLCVPPPPEPPQPADESSDAGG